jgi:chitinase
MNKMNFLLPALLLSFVFSSYREESRRLMDASKRTRPVIIGYVGGYRGAVNVDSIEVEKLTHINYAFVDVKAGQAFLHNLSTDTVNLLKLGAARQRNPSLKILISIGGWAWSKNFSDAVLTDSSRSVFAHSAIVIVAAYGLDGIDIDWEYPGQIGDQNIFRPEDKENYTAMFKTLRQGLDSLAGVTGKKYLVTTAVGAGANFISHTEMDKAQQYLDYVNVMSYDFREGADTLSGHHTNLFASSADPEGRSADRAISLFVAAGVPENKLVMGIAFYGHGWKMRSRAGDGLYQPASAPYRAGGYTYLKDSLISQNGYKQHWDRKAKAPWLFQQDQQIFISYDNERSVRAKCRYVRKHGLAGVMFWEYFSDRKGYLLDAINQAF